MQLKEPKIKRWFDLNGEKFGIQDANYRLKDRTIMSADFNIPVETQNFTFRANNKWVKASQTQTIDNKQIVFAHYDKAGKLNQLNIWNPHQSLKTIVCDAVCGKGTGA